MKTRQKVPQKSENAKKRDKLPMDAFNCHGWLKITISNDCVAYITLNHDDAHVPYWSIDIPKEVIQYIEENAQLSMTQVSPMDINTQRLRGKSDVLPRFGTASCRKFPGHLSHARPCVMFGFAPVARSGSGIQTSSKAPRFCWKKLETIRIHCTKLHRLIYLLNLAIRAWPSPSRPSCANGAEESARFPWIPPVRNLSEPSACITS